MFNLSNKQYDKLQKLMRIFVPLVTFLTALGEIWGIPWMGLITATISAFGIFLGQVLTASSKKYKEAKEDSEPETVEEDVEE